MTTELQTERDLPGAKWLVSAGIKDISDFGCQVANMLDQWQHGIYHIGREVLHKRTNWKDDRWIEVTIGMCLATYDFDNLTTLVFLAHEHRIRVEINGAANGYLRLSFSPRKETGRIYERHPSLLEAYSAWSGVEV